MIAGFVLQLFWLSFSLIGLAALLWYHKLRPQFALPRLLYSWHPFVLFLVCFATGVGVFALPAVIWFVFSWPLTLFIWLYILVLVGALSTLWLQREGLRAIFGQVKLSRGSLITLSILGLIIALEYCMALWTGPDLNDDTPVHVAHIQLIVSLHHFTLSDPFTGYNGILDPRYSANLLYALNALAASLFHLTAYKVWVYSFAFFKLLLGFGTFSLIRVFFAKSIPKIWAYYILILMPFFSFTYFYNYAELPHNVALVWTACLFIGLKLMFERGSYGLFFVSIILLGTTHVLASTYVLAFLGLLVVVGLLLKLVSFAQVRALILGMILLGLPLFVNQLVPGRSSTLGLKDTTGHGLHTVDLEIKRTHNIVWPLVRIVDPGAYRTPTNGQFSFLIDPWALPAVGILAAYVVLLKRLKSTRIKQGVLLLLTGAVLGLFNTLYLSFVTFVYLLKHTKHKGVKLTLFLAIIFYGAIALNPVALTVLYGHIPLYVIARFEDLNVFAFFAPLLGVFILYRWVARYWGIPKMERGVSVVILMLVAGAVLYRFPLNTASILSFDKGARQQTRYDYKVVDSLKPLDAYLRNQVIYTNNNHVNYWYPMIASNQVGEVLNNQSSQQNNLPQRRMCSAKLETDLAQSDLQAARVTRVVLSVGKDASKFQTETARTASQKPYLQAMYRDNTYAIYKVVVFPRATPAPHSVCAIPYGQ